MRCHDSIDKFCDTSLVVGVELRPELRLSTMSSNIRPTPHIFIRDVGLLFSFMADH